MLNKIPTRYTCIPFVAITLFACGGGDSQSNNVTLPLQSTAATLSIDIDESSIILDEGAAYTLPINVNYTGTETLQYEVSTDNDSVFTGTVSGSDVDVQAKNVVNIQNEALLKVTVSDGSISDSKSVSVSVINTSFFEEQAALTQIAKTLVSYTHSDVTNTNLLLFLTDVSYQVGLIDKDTMHSLVAQRQSQATEITDSLRVSTSDLLVELESYTAESNGSEEILQQLEQSMEEAQSIYANAFNGVFSEVESLDGLLLPRFTLETLHFSDPTYSLYVGNSQMGEFDDEGWVFNAEFLFMTPILDNPSVCYTL